MCLGRVFYQTARILRSCLCLRIHMCLHHALLHVTIDLNKDVDTVVLAFFFCGKSADSVLFIGKESSLVSISVCVEVLSAALSCAVVEASVVLISVGVYSESCASVVT